jgi:hypothetical protein
MNTVRTATSSISVQAPASRGSRRVLVFVVLACAALLRVAMCGMYVFNDEDPIVRNVLTFFRDRTVVPTHFAYPTLFSYLAAVPTAIGAAVLRTMGLLPSTGDLGALLTIDSLYAVLPGRLTSCLFAMLTLVVVHAIGRRFYSPWIGLGAMCLLAFSALHIEYSAYALPDVTMTCFAACSLWFSWRALDGGKSSDFIWSSVFAGLTASTKYNGALVLVALVFAECDHLYREGRLRPRTLVLNPRWPTIGLAFGAAFLIGSPGWLLQPASFYTAITRESAHMQTGHFGFFGPRYVQQLVLLWQWEKSWAIVFIAGVLYAAYRRTPQDLLLLSVVVSGFAIIGAWQKQDLHYLLFLYPAVSVLAARFVVDVARACEVRSLRVAWVSAIVAISVWPLYSATARAAAEIGTDTRWMAAEWIQSRVEEGSTIVLEDEHSHLPRFFSADEKERLLGSDHRRFYEQHLARVRTYTLVPLVYDPAWVASVSGDYLVVGSDTFERYFTTALPPSDHPLYEPFVARRATYQAIFDGRGGWTFERSFVGRKGPRILVYRQASPTRSGRYAGQLRPSALGNAP